MIIDKNSDYASPDFICVGPHKTGTTWLHFVLGYHASVNKSAIKELQYFHQFKLNSLKCGQLRKSYSHLKLLWSRRKLKLNQIRKLRSKDIPERQKQIIRKRLDFDRRILLNQYSFKFYSSFFDCSDKITGDISPQYFFLKKDIIKLINDLYPNTKILIFLREPVSRFKSYLQMQMTNRGTPPSARNIRKCIKRIHKYYKPDYLIRGMTNWLDVFPKEQIFIGFFDDLKANQVDYYRKICRFLDISDNLEEAIDYRNIKKKESIKGIKKVSKFESIEELLGFRYGIQTLNIALHKNTQLELIDQYYNQVSQLSKFTDSPHPQRWIKYYDKIRAQSLILDD